jgi:peptidoglycan/LPS O-acetylase OafA/YrhL
VVSVIVNHLTHWPRGGFVGVDIFFVISGFLITGILMREQDGTGTISFIRFYRRRVKRILPAAVLVLIATVTFSHFIVGATRAKSIIVDALWGLLFSANWRFATESTNYFQANGPVSPLQHFWSLAVEEQFYFVWPWVMLFVLAVLVRRRAAATRARVVVGIVLVVITAASFVWGLHETATDPNSAYFSTFSRAWELGVGALLAVVQPAVRRLPAAVRPVLSWLGLAGIVASLIVITDSVTFPVPWAALPVAGCALVILAGTGVEQQRLVFPLTNRASGYVGDISYSLYIWHFPIIILGEAVWGDQVVVRCAISAAIVIISVYSYHLIENPIRKSGLLVSGFERMQKRMVRNPWANDGSAAAVSYKPLSASLFVVAALVVSAAALVPPTPPKTIIVAQVATDMAATTTPRTPGLDALQSQITSALQSTSWPSNLRPSLDQTIARDQEAPDDIAGCAGANAVVETDCTWGDRAARHRAVVVGDSVGVTFVPGLRSALGSNNGWALTSYAGFGCPFVAARTVNPDAGLTKACPGRKQDAVAAIRRIHPDVVFVINSYNVAEDYQTTTLPELNMIKSAAGRFVFISAPPFDKVLSECFTPRSTPADCVSSVTSEWTTRLAAEQQLAASVHGEFIDSRPWFCYDDQCPSFVGMTPTKIDQLHMTVQYSVKIAPVIREYFQQHRTLSATS